MSAAALLFSFCYYVGPILYASKTRVDKWREGWSHQKGKTVKQLIPQFAYRCSGAAGVSVLRPTCCATAGLGGSWIELICGSTQSSTWWLHQSTYSPCWNTSNKSLCSNDRCSSGCCCILLFIGIFYYFLFNLTLVLVYASFVCFCGCWQNAQAEQHLIL